MEKKKSRIVSTGSYPVLPEWPEDEPVRRQLASLQRRRTSTNPFPKLPRAILSLALSWLDLRDLAHVAATCVWLHESPVSIDRLLLDRGNCAVLHTVDWRGFYQLLRMTSASIQSMALHNTADCLRHSAQTNDMWSRCRDLIKANGLAHGLSVIDQQLHAAWPLFDASWLFSLLTPSSDGIVLYNSSATFLDVKRLDDWKGPLRRLALPGQLSSKKLQTLMEQRSKNDRLTTLDITHPPNDDLCALLRTMPKLQALTLRNPLRSPVDVQSMIQACPTTLTNFRLTQAISSVSPIVARFQDLRTLHLCSNELSKAWQPLSQLSLTKLSIDVDNCVGFNMDASWKAPTEGPLLQSLRTFCVHRPLSFSTKTWQTIHETFPRLEEVDGTIELAFREHKNENKWLQGATIPWRRLAITFGTLHRIKKGPERRWMRDLLPAFLAKHSKRLVELILEAPRATWKTCPAWTDVLLQHRMPWLKHLNVTGPVDWDTETVRSRIMDHFPLLEHLEVNVYAGAKHSIRLKHSDLAHWIRHKPRLWQIYLNGPGPIYNPLTNVPRSHSDVFNESVGFGVDRFYPSMFDGL